MFLLDYDGTLSAGGLSPEEYDASANWKYCSDIYKNATGKVPENAEGVIKTKDGSTQFRDLTFTDQDKR